ncbi:olfactory receptor 14J1-like [Tachyglossus aculeatus]|uniref:olfactory receptor 14J1-like n=1 Tax=Tachyglossus aculeatus TaxID=9261 RepID=UPI0018F3BD22|nr:olfactory receptor 14J1-like [Tachyglossus aculeatus]
MSSVTTVMDILLLGFSEFRELQLGHAVLFLLVYLDALMGNFLIITVTALDRHLHIPMYFFFRNLSVLDLCLISVTVPKSISNAVINSRSISRQDAVGILTAMSYDGYGTICRPLRYDIIMAPRALIHHFFSDAPQVLKLVCPEDSGRNAIHREPSFGAFSTFLPLLVVVTLFLSSGGFEYLNPVPESPSLPDFLLPMFYAVVPPTLNPVI